LTRPGPGDGGASHRPPGPGGGSRPLGAPGPPPGWEARLGRLAEAIEQFRVDSERYFNGGLVIPPEELRARIERELRDLRSSPSKSAADQFRLGGLEARFNSLSELFGRRLREREEGRGRAPVQVVPETPRFDARSGIVLSKRLDGSAVEALWQGLAAAGGGARLELETFRGYLTRQIAEIRTRTGSEAVQFRVVNEGGRVKLKAKPIDPGSES